MKRFLLAALICMSGISQASEAWSITPTTIAVEKFKKIILVALPAYLTGVYFCLRQCGNSKKYYEKKGGVFKTSISSKKFPQKKLKGLINKIDPSYGRVLKKFISVDRRQLTLMEYFKSALPPKGFKKKSKWCKEFCSNLNPKIYECVLIDTRKNAKMKELPISFIEGAFLYSRYFESDIELPKQLGSPISHIEIKFESSRRIAAGSYKGSV